LWRREGSHQMRADERGDEDTNGNGKA
jgi:hypothetical protein